MPIRCIWVSLKLVGTASLRMLSTMLFKRSWRIQTVQKALRSFRVKAELDLDREALIRRLAKLSDRRSDKNAPNMKMSIIATRLKRQESSFLKVKVFGSVSQRRLPLKCRSMSGNATLGTACLRSWHRRIERLGAMTFTKAHLTRAPLIVGSMVSILKRHGFKTDRLSASSLKTCVNVHTSRSTKTRSYKSLLRTATQTSIVLAKTMACNIGLIYTIITARIPKLTKTLVSVWSSLNGSHQMSLSVILASIR